MVQKFRDNIWHSLDGITEKELADLELIEMFAINKIITEQQMIYRQVRLSEFFPQILTYLPLAQN